MRHLAVEALTAMGRLGPYWSYDTHLELYGDSGWTGA
jgi:hypothetical protein